MLERVLMSFFAPAITMKWRYSYSFIVSFSFKIMNDFIFQVQPSEEPSLRHREKRAISGVTWHPQQHQSSGSPVLVTRPYQTHSARHQRTQGNLGRSLQRDLWIHYRSRSAAKHEDRSHSKERPRFHDRAGAESPDRNRCSGFVWKGLSLKDATSAASWGSLALHLEWSVGMERPSLAKITEGIEWSLASKRKASCIFFIQKW